MNSMIFTENLKKYRIAKKYTQEQVAASLGVNTQTVSRWECGTTLPDVLTLPELAKLYEVTVDDFYRKNTIAYDNYAQRLCAEYERTRDPEDFLRCVVEYQKLMRAGDLSITDKWNYAIIHHFMLNHCKKTAMEWYDKTLAENPDSNPHVYYRACERREKLFFDIGRGEEFIQMQEAKVNTHPNTPQEWDLLVTAYIHAQRYEEGYACFLKAIEKFPDDWQLYIHGGELCSELGKYDEALKLWDKAGEIGTYFHDEMYCKAILYKDTGEYEKSCQMYLNIANLLRGEGYDVEAEMAEESANEAILLMSMQ